jgi:hypothetical protein
MAYKNIVQVGVRLMSSVQATISDPLNRPQAPSASPYSTPSLLLASSTSPSSLVTLPSPKSPPRTTSVRSRWISPHTKHSSTPSAATKPSSSLWAISPTWQEHPDPHRRSHRCRNQARNSFGVRKVRLRLSAPFGMELTSGGSVICIMHRERVRRSSRPSTMLSRMSKERRRRARSLGLLSPTEPSLTGD